MVASESPRPPAPPPPAELRRTAAARLSTRLALLLVLALDQPASGGRAAEGAA